MAVAAIIGSGCEKCMSRLPAFLNQQPPLKHDVFRNLEHTTVEHRTHPLRQPIVQFGPAISVNNNFNAKPNFGKCDHADVKLVECAAGNERNDFLIRPWPAQFRKYICIKQPCH
jgi:hypothetical protein